MQANMTPLEVMHMSHALTNATFELTVAREHIVRLEHQRLQDALYIHQLSEGSEWLRRQNMVLLQKMKQLRSALPHTPPNCDSEEQSCSSADAPS